MAPLVARSFDVRRPFGELRMQWSNPSDVFSVLLLLGGDVVSRALAQIAGGTITPVTFSFGWVAYAVAAIVSCVGENKLMPDTPDCASIVINGKSGYVRTNSSWILGRILRDYEHWMPERARKELDEHVKHKSGDVKQASGAKVPRAGLFVSVFRASKEKTAGVPDLDMVWFSGIFVGVIQLGVACIPFGIYGDWSILLITAFGILLCFTTGALPQWRHEKWNCRKNMDNTYILTRGNGAQHALVIIGGGHGLNFEDLAASESGSDGSASWLTRISLIVLALLWIALLIFSSGLQENTWFLLAVGGLGIVHNAAVAGWPRRPENFGVHLEQVTYIGGSKVMPVLMDTERQFPHIGRSMLQTFFPGQLWASEEQEWHLLGLEAKAHDAEEKAGRLEEEVKARRFDQETTHVRLEKNIVPVASELDQLVHKAVVARQNAVAARRTAREARIGSENLKKAGHAMTI